MSLLTSLLAIGSLLEAKNRSNSNSESFAKIVRAFKSADAAGMDTQIDLSGCDPELIRDSAAIKEFVKQLCDIINAKQSGIAQVGHRNERAIAGYSVTQITDTGYVSASVANTKNNLYLNIFSLLPHNPYEAAELGKEFFHAQAGKLNVTLR
jgi:hypothetical protein